MDKPAWTSRIALLLVWFVTALWGDVASGQISFGPSTAFPAGVFPARLIAADLDGDLDIDFATEDNGQGHVSVLLNNGDGTYATPVVYTVSSGVRALASGDLNGDGFVDVAVARSGPFPAGAGVISVLLNQGDGSLAAAIDFAVITSGVPGQQLTPQGLVAADLNGDGKTDLAAATVLLNDAQQPGFMSIVLNTGNNALGEPALAPSVEIDVSEAFARAITAGDFDNDGDNDLATAHALGASTNSIAVFLNDGNGVTGLVRSNVVTGPVASPFDIIAGDVNADSFLDLVTINAFHSYSVFLNGGGQNPGQAGRFSDNGQLPLGDQPPPGFPATDLPSGGTLADLDGDLDLDLAAGLLGDSGPGSLAVLPNLGTGPVGPELNFGLCLDFGAVVSGDFDGDGDTDIASANGPHGVVMVLLNRLIPPPVPAGDPADADGDGVPDCNDGCPFDVNKSSPGQCGCGHPDTDTDGDGVADCIDPCPIDNPNDSDGDGVCDSADICPGFNDAIDTDGDGVPDGCDICPGFDDTIDTDGDGVPDGCDVCAGFNDGIDTDGDGAPDGCDICPGFDDAIDTDGDGVPDGCDICPGFDDSIDTDGDGVPDGCDICPGFDDTIDTDGDGVPDGCDICPGFDDAIDTDGAGGKFGVTVRAG